MAYQEFNAAANRKIVRVEEYFAIARKLAGQRLSMGERLYEATIGKATLVLVCGGMMIDAMKRNINRENFHQYSGSDGKLYMDGAAISTFMERHLKSYFNKSLGQKLWPIGVEAFEQSRNYTGSPVIAKATQALR